METQSAELWTLRVAGGAGPHRSKDVAVAQQANRADGRMPNAVITAITETGEKRDDPSADLILKLLGDIDRSKGAVPHRRGDSGSIRSALC